MIKFGTGGWRAVIGDEFIKSNIQLLSYAMCKKIKAEGVENEPVVIGYDRRFLSKEAMQWSAVVFAAEGITTLLVKRSSPTPLVMHHMMKHGMHYGMMITASHNPATYNGIKVFTKGGRDADEIQTADIERYITQVEGQNILVPTMEYENAVKLGLIQEIYPLNEYLDDILDAVDVKAIRKAGLRVAIDPLYGVADTSLKIFLYTSRCEVFPIHDEHDTLFGSNLPAPNEETLRELQNFVLDKGCDIGLGTDGDADRIGIIDDKGRFLHANDILVLLYYYLVKYKGWHGPVVRNLATTHALDKIAAKFGETCYEVPVGFKHISAKMNETDAVLGGESSGGLTVRGHISGKDGVYAAALLVEMVAVVGKPLSQIYADIEEEFGTIHMEEHDYKFSVEKKITMQKTLMEEHLLPEMPYAIDHVSYKDGCKVYFANGGWVIARFSGTEPLIRIFCEMPNPKDAKRVILAFEEFLGL